MEDMSANGTIIGLVITALISGIGWLVKYFFHERDKKRKEEMTERNKRREQIENSVLQLHEDVDNLQAIILECKQPNCESKKAMADYLRQRRKKTLTGIN